MGMRNYLFVALLGLGACAADSSSSSTPPPPAPGAIDTSFVAFGSSSSTVTLAWEPVAGATSYTLERKPDGGDYAPVATVTGTDYLDTGLAAQTAYTYRLTAVGASAVHEHTAITSDSPPLVTGDPVPHGVPTVQAIGAAGGTIILSDPKAMVIVPAGAVPDGTSITVQPIVGPVATNTTLGLEITSSAPFAQPIDVAFALDAADLESPANAVIALQQADGTWLAQHRTVDIAGGKVTSTVAPSAIGARLVPGAPYKLRITRLQATYITPMQATVKVNETLQLHAFGIFSDLTCQVAPGASADWTCLAIAAGAIKIGSVDATELNRPIHGQELELHNQWPGYSRTWTVENAPLGTSQFGFITIPTNMGATYMAPAVKPNPNPVAVRFESTQDPASAPDGVAFQARSRPSLLTIEGGMGYHVVAKFDARNDLDPCPLGSADVTDGFELDVVPDADGNYHILGITNQATAHDTLVYPTQLWPSAPVITQEMEQFTATDGSAMPVTGSNVIEVTVTGTSLGSQCYVTLGDGTKNTATGATPPTMIQFGFDKTTLDMTTSPAEEWTYTITAR